jgi:hypothetical protein
MNGLFRFPDAIKRNPTIELWLEERAPELGATARTWFQRMRECGPDVRELMHDGCPTVCVEDAAFAYVGVFKAHVNVGFFRGADLHDPRSLLEGTGERMRHVKIRPGVDLDARALGALIREAYGDMKVRVATAGRDDSSSSREPSRGRRR